MSREGRDEKISQQKEAAEVEGPEKVQRLKKSSINIIKHLFNEYFATKIQDWLLVITRSRTSS